MAGGNILDYPDDFDISAFPAGKWIAISRSMGIWSITLFLVIIACCIALPWIQNNQTVHPYIIYVNGERGEWELIGREKVNKDIAYYQSVQHSLVGIFTKKWFTISGNPGANANNWGRQNRDTVCAQTIPTTMPQPDGGDIYCIADEGLYQTFVSSVLPLYQTYESFGEQWYIDADKIEITPNGPVTSNGGAWIIRAGVQSNINGKFDVIAYVCVGYEPNRYPQTLGYYIKSFNAYRD